MASEHPQSLEPEGKAPVRPAALVPSKRRLRKRLRQVTTTAQPGPFAVIEGGQGKAASAKQTSGKAKAADQLRAATRALAGGRVSKDGTRFDAYIANSFPMILPPNDSEGQWELLQLDVNALSRVSPDRLVQLLIDLSPDASRALWDWQRLCNPGYEYDVFAPGTKTALPKGKKVIDDFMTLLREKHGSADVVLNRLFNGAFTRGAFCAELVMDDSGMFATDLATPDPGSIRFRKKDDQYIACQFQPRIPGNGAAIAGNLVDVNRPTFRYVPVDPMPGSPYGRAPIAPALFCTLFLLGLLHDLRRVVAQQGYPRVDVEVIAENLKNQMPDGLQDDPDKYTEWLQDAIDQVQTAYSYLEPDDAYVHSDAIKVNKNVGAVDASSLGAVPGLFQVLERMTMRALKTMPVLMGTGDGASEAYANRQWEVQAASVKSLQHLCENMLEHLLVLMLRAQGIIADVRFRFAELRASEMMRDEQTFRLRIMNQAMLYDRGIISQQEMANNLIGHEPDQAAPRVEGVGTKGEPPAGISGPDATNPEPGEARARHAEASRQPQESGESPLSESVILQTLSESLAHVAQSSRLTAEEREQTSALIRARIERLMQKMTEVESQVQRTSDKTEEAVKEALVSTLRSLKPRPMRVTRTLQRAEDGTIVGALEERIPLAE